MQWRSAAVLEPADAPTSVEGYMGPVPAGEVEPPDYTRFERQAFLVRMRSDRPVLRVHYHPVDQFQVFCWGEAEFAGHSLEPGAVHYADRFTPYGPLKPVGAGTSFLTLRSESAKGAHYMPESRDELAALLRDDEREPSDRRNLSFDLVTPTDGGSVVDLRDDEDGLRIRRMRLEPAESSPDLEIGGDGAFLVVVDGAVDRGGDGEAGRGSVAWCEPGERIRVSSGPDGAVVAVLQFPLRPDPSV